MPRPPKPLTAEQKELISRLVGYDEKLDALVWKPRQPSDFHTWVPERTAAGFNRKFAGKPIGFDSLGRVCFTIRKKTYQISQPKVRHFLGAPQNTITRFANPMQYTAAERRHPHAQGTMGARTNPDGNVFDRDVVRALIEMDDAGWLRWKQPDIRKAVPILQAAVDKVRDYEKVTEYMLKRWAVRQAGAKVRVSTAGVVRLLGVLRLGPAFLLQVFPGARIDVTEAGEKVRVPVPDALVAKLFSYREGSGVYYKEWDKAVWFELVMIGAFSKMPSDAEIETKNLRAGEKVSLHTSKRAGVLYAQIGRKCVSINRIKALCAI
jgi:hypothetical protein